MSESYTEGGDTFAVLYGDHQSGQTFRVLQEHVLEWIDLDIKGSTIMTHPVLLLYYADAHHQPLGDYLSRNRGYIVQDRHATGLRRVRFPMQSLKLSPLSYYMMVLLFFPGALEAPIQWHYDAGDATYPRGHRIRREGYDDPWTSHVGDDHIFAEFGSPPAPPPPPDPPIPNFAILNLGYTPTAEGLKLTTWSNVPCHQYMFWTTVEPEKHFEAILRRGLATSDQIRYCFVTWHMNEQLQAGDTMYHTFIKEPWPVCETRWFTFRAKIDGEWSPSVGPIFKHHNAAPIYALIINEPWTI